MGYGAPEFLVMIALIQRHEAAQALWEMWKRGYGNWTIAHGFYLNMGGIVLDVGGRRRFPITYKQLVVLLDHSVVTLPDISEDEIKDKSKADGFAKAVSCMQVGWLAVQSIARAKQHLPLTTLELTTLGFVANSLVVFYIWWEKPTDVQVPTVLRMENKADEALRQLFGEDNLKCSRPRRGCFCKGCSGLRFAIHSGGHRAACRRMAKPSSLGRDTCRRCAVCCWHAECCGGYSASDFRAACCAYFFSSDCF